MQITCPACGKANLPDSEAVCTRCGCDLSGLRQVRRAAAWHARAALGSLRLTNWADALKSAEQSWALNHSVLVARLAALAAAALGDTAKAVRWRHSANTQKSEPEN